jgi:hypothetical protein
MDFLYPFWIAILAAKPYRFFGEPELRFFGEPELRFFGEPELRFFGEPELRFFGEPDSGRVVISLLLLL